MSFPLWVVTVQREALGDQYVSAEGSLKFFSALKAANVPAEMHIFDEGGHGFDSARQRQARRSLAGSLPAG